MSEMGLRYNTFIYWILVLQSSMPKRTLLNMRTCIHCFKKRVLYLIIREATYDIEQTFLTVTKYGYWDSVETKVSIGFCCTNCLISYLQCIIFIAAILLKRLWKYFPWQSVFLIIYMSLGRKYFHHENKNFLTENSIY